MSQILKGEDNNRCVLTLSLLTEPYQEHIIEKRFRIMEHLANSLIAKELRKLKALERRKDYRLLLEEIKGTPKEKRKTLNNKRSKMIKDAGFDKYTFINDMTPMQKHFCEHIATQVSHKTAADIWNAFDRYFYGDGKTIHFKRRGTMSSIANKTMGNGMDYKDGYFIWNGGQTSKKIKLKIRVAAPQTEYEKEMLRKKIKYVRILRKWMKTRYKYYLQFTLEGTAVKKDRAIYEGRVGIDIGTQSIAIVSEKGVHLLELANRVNDNHEKLLRIQRKMDNSRRVMNPENYNADGTIARGRKLIWRQSAKYKKLTGKARELYRKNADIRKYQHTCLANYIISLGNHVFIEPMNYKGLQRRAKETKRGPSGRCLRKKRFGKSLAKKAPAMFVSILEDKLIQYGGSLVNVDKWEYRASQYDHLSKKYIKKTLAQRIQMLQNGDILQRDLYSAFLLMNADDTLKKPDDNLLDRTYDTFKKLHDKEIKRLMGNPDKNLSSFGIA